MSSDRVVSCLGSFAEILSDPAGYEPERLKALSRDVPDLISTFIEAILSSDEDAMQEKLIELADYATHVNSFQAWFNLGFLAQRLFFHQAAIEYYEKSASLARAQGDNENVSRVLFSLGSLYGEEEDWNRACECYVKALQAGKGCEKSPVMRQILGNLGSIYRLQGEYSQAAGCYSRVIDLLGSDDRAGRAEAFGNLGDDIPDARGPLQGRGMLSQVPE